MEFFLGAFETEWQARRAALLHERGLGPTKRDEDEERRRRGGSVPGAWDRQGGVRGFGRITAGRWSASAAGRLGGRSGGEPSMRSRFQRLAKGSQPVVVKLASFGGGGRIGAMISYVSRSGQVSVENERGALLAGRDGISAVQGEWDHLMSNRAESRDIGTFTIDVKSAGQEEGWGEQARDILSAGLGNRRFGYSVSPRPDVDGFAIDGVLVLRDNSGERLTGDRKASEIVEARIAGSIVDDGRETSGRSVAFRFSGHGNGTDYGAARLRDLVANRAGVRDEAGREITDARQASDLVQLEWRPHLHSRRSRDVMHLVLSARAGTYALAFQSAAREFLGRQFAGHRYVFSMHDPADDPKAEEAGGKRPHVHVHAIVAMRSDFGERVETSIASFRQWRVTMAEAARANGIDMEMTDRRDRASPPAFSRNQVRPISRSGRTQHEGTSEAAQARYDGQRRDLRSIASTSASRNYTEIAKFGWLEIASSHSEDAGTRFAKSQLNRIIAGNFDANAIRTPQVANVNSGSQYETYLVTLQKVISGDADMQQMNRKEFDIYEKLVAGALDRAERVMPEGQREAFAEIASAAREHVDARRELMEMAEAKNVADKTTELQADREAETPEARWDAAVARHGVQVVEAANRVLLEVEHYRDALDDVRARGGKADEASLKASLNLELASAGELGAAGNSLIREVAEADTELRVAVEAAERSRERAADRNKADGMPDSVGSSVPNYEVPAERGGDGDDWNRTDDAQRPGDRKSTDRPRETAKSNESDMAKTDPARQHVPRLVLQRDADERRARDQDDQER